MPDVPNYLAGNESLGSWQPKQIFAGQSDIVTDDGETVAVAFAQYQIVSRLTAGGIAPYNPAGADGSQVAIGIACQAGTVGKTAQWYTGGVFNHDALVWPASVDTLVKRKSVFARTNIQISSLY